MSQELKKEKKSKTKANSITPNNQRIAPKKKKKEEKQLSSFEEILEEIKKVDIEKPKAFEELLTLFEVLRKLKVLTNNQIDNFFQIVEEKAGGLWVPMLVKMTMSLCRDKQGADLRIIQSIRAICKTRLELFGILESGLTNAERNVCLQVNGKFVTQFLKDAYKQSQKNEQQISNADLACLSFICFTLYCKTSYDGDSKIQKAIDRAIAEFFSSQEISGVREKDLAGKTIGNIMAAKVFSPKKIAELTYLYSETTELIAEQVDTIRSLEETKRGQADRIAYLTGENKSIKVQNQELQDRINTLNIEVQQLTEERTAAENMLAFEKNKYELQLNTQGTGLAKRLTYDIGLELETLRDLVAGLEPYNQRRFGRRLDSIELYLREFGGDK